MVILAVSKGGKENWAKLLISLPLFSMALFLPTYGMIGGYFRVEDRSWYKAFGVIFAVVTIGFPILTLLSLIIYESLFDVL